MTDNFLCDFWWFCWLEPPPYCNKNTLGKIWSKFGIGRPPPPQLGQKTKFFQCAYLKAPLMHDSLPSWHRLVEEWMGCSSHTTMLILSPILTSTGRWTLAWSTIASKSIHYINSKRGSAIPCCNNWRAILFAHWYKLVQQFFSKKTFGGIFYHFERSELYQTSFLDDHIFPRGSL